MFNLLLLTYQRSKDYYITSSLEIWGKENDKERVGSLYNTAFY